MSAAGRSGQLAPGWSLLCACAGGPPRRWFGSLCPAVAHPLPRPGCSCRCPRSYFPLFPPPPGSMLDTSKAAGLDMPATPDLLLLPSDMAPFAKLAAAGAEGRVVCINPGRLTKGATGEERWPGGRAPRGASIGGRRSLWAAAQQRRCPGAHAGGTYAHVYVAPHEEAAGLAPASTNAPIGHQADTRCRVEIRRI